MHSGFTIKPTLTTIIMIMIEPQTSSNYYAYERSSRHKTCKYTYQNLKRDQETLSQQQTYPKKSNIAPHNTTNRGTMTA